MYICRHCGLQYMTDEAVMCMRCQAPRGAGNQFCPCCGAPVRQPMQNVCLNCGVEMEGYGNTSPKSKVAAGLFALFLGTLGVHNFYLGYTKKAVVQLVLSLSAYIAYIAAIIGIAEPKFNSYLTFPAMVAIIIAIIYFFIVICCVGIWVFVEAIMILCGKINKDGKGRRIK